MHTSNTEQLKNVRRIVTHGGGAHEDDFIAVALALHLIGAAHTTNKPSVVVERRDPSEAEILDPEVLVLDVGKAYKPECLTFDHHQYDDEAVQGQCALSLFVRWLGLGPVFSVQRWYKHLVMGDAVGPFAVAADLELARFPFELESPIARALLSAFAECNRLEPSELLHKTMCRIGKSILDAAKRFETRYRHLSVHGTHMSPNSVRGILVQEDLSDFDIYEVAQTLKDDGTWAASQFIMFHSQRGEGWDFFRFNDSEQVDFSVLQGKPGIDFAHNAGFYCQTSERLEVPEVLGLVRAALVGTVTRAESALKDPQDLPLDDLTEVVRAVQATLWRACDGAVEPDKEWDSDTLSAIGGILSDNGLDPQ